MLDPFRPPIVPAERATARLRTYEMRRRGHLAASPSNSTQNLGQVREKDEGHDEV